MIGSLEIIDSHQMEKLLKKGHFDIIYKIHSIQEFENPSPTMHPNLLSLLSQHQYFFENPQEIPPSRGTNDHSIPLVPERFLPMFTLIIIPFPIKMKLIKLFRNF